jgi:rod shape-determining protein MreC
MSTLRSRTLVTGLLLLASIALVGLNAVGILDPVKSGVFAPLAATQSWIGRRFSAVYGFFTLPRDLQALRDRNAELEQQVADLQLQLVQAQEQQAELLILSGLLNYARENPTNRYIAADVIGRDTSPFLKFLILNRGSDDGLSRGMPVVTNQGLVGQIAEVTANAARVQLIIDPGSAVNVRIQSSRAEGAVVGQLAGDLSLEFIPQDTPLLVGDRVLTSGVGGTYPEDVVVGEVLNVRQQVAQIFQEATVRAAVEFDRLEIVLVLSNFTPANLTPFQPTPAGP